MTAATRATLNARESRSVQEENQQSRAKWTNDLSKTLVDLMVEQVQNGNRTRTSFTRRAWKSITDEFYLKTGLKWDEQQLKSRYIALKKQYPVIKSLLDQTQVFHFDDPTGNVVATDEAWAEYIKEHPDAEQIRNHGFPLYNQLSLIFSSIVANGRSNNHESLEQQEHSHQPPDDIREDVELSSESEAVEEIVGDQPSTYRQPSAAARDSRKRGRKGVDDAIAAAMQHMAAASKLYTTVAADVDAKYSIADCIKSLDEMQGVDQEVYFAALDLFNCRSKREIFMSLRSDRRLTWLQGKL